MRFLFFKSICQTANPKHSHMAVIEINDITDRRVACFTSLTEAELRSEAITARPLFIAESPKVIRTALDAGMQPEAMLCERRHITGDAADIVARCGDMPVYTASREVLASLTGYTLTRGVLCAMRRPGLPSVADICRGSQRIAVIHGVCDTTNIGAIFRSAAALGFDGVTLSPDSCDPLNRRSIRVSMGTVFQIPWTWLRAGIGELHEAGFTTAAMALDPHAMQLDDPRLQTIPRLAVVLGTEGDGLPRHIIEECTCTVTIPMLHGVDSLNVGAAAAVAFWQLRARQ